MSAQTKDHSGRPASTLSVKANRPSLRIAIPSSSFPLEEPSKEEIAAVNPSLHGNTSPKEGIFSVNIAFPHTDSNVGIAGECTKKKSRIPVVRFSNSCNPPPMEFTVPTSPVPHAGYWNYSDQSEKQEGISSVSIAFPLTDSNVGIAGDCTMKKSRIPVVRFSDSCNSPPMEFTVPTSPAPHAGYWYYSDQSEEPSPGRSDTLENTIESLLDSYLWQDNNGAHDSPINYLPCDEADEEVSEHWDGSSPGPRGAEDFLECLYDLYLDEDMTLETVN